MVSSSTNITGIVIAGGAGIRLRPLTYIRPKPMVPLVDKPLVQYQVELLRTHGITDVVFCVGKSTDQVQGYFGTGERFGVNTAYSIEDKPLGTAGAIRFAEPQMKSDTALVMNGDNLVDYDLSLMVRFHQETGADVTIGLMEVPSPTPCGVVKVDSENRVISFNEPDEKTKRMLAAGGYEITGTATVNGGIYVISRSILHKIPFGSACSIEKEFFPSVINGGCKVFGYLMQGYWLDVGTPANYIKAHRDLLGGNVSACVTGEKTTQGYWVHSSAHVDSGADVMWGTYIGSDCRIGEDVRLKGFTTLGPGCVVGKGSSLDGCILLENVVVGDNCKLRNCVIDRDARIGDGINLGDGSIIAAGSVLA